MNKDEFLVFFGKLFDEPCDEELSMDTEFRYLDNWSSLTGLYYITEMDEKFGKKISVSEFKACETLEDLYQLYQSK